MPKAKEKKAEAANKPKPELLHTADVAKMLKLDGKTLRKHLRAISGKAPGTRYEWEENDPFLKKLPDLIKAQEEKESAKKAAKK
jgi:hypothetical protein